MLDLEGFSERLWTHPAKKWTCPTTNIFELDVVKWMTTRSLTRSEKSLSISQIDFSDLENHVVVKSPGCSIFITPWSPCVIPRWYPYPISTDGDATAHQDIVEMHEFWSTGPKKTLCLSWRSFTVRSLEMGITWDLKSGYVRLPKNQPLGCDWWKFPRGCSMYSSLCFVGQVFDGFLMFFGCFCCKVLFKTSGMDESNRQLSQWCWKAEKPVLLNCERKQESQLIFTIEYLYHVFFPDFFPPKGDVEITIDHFESYCWWLKSCTSW